MKVTIAGNNSSALKASDQELGRIFDKRLEGCMRIATTEIKPDIERLFK
jgi:hypothetical protein